MQNFLQAYVGLRVNNERSQGREASETRSLAMKTFLQGLTVSKIENFETARFETDNELAPGSIELGSCHGIRGRLVGKRKNRI